MVRLRASNKGTGYHQPYATLCHLMKELRISEWNHGGKNPRLYVWGVVGWGRLLGIQKKTTMHSVRIPKKKDFLGCGGGVALGGFP